MQLVDCRTQEVLEIGNGIRLTVVKKYQGRLTLSVVAPAGARLESYAWDLQEAVLPTGEQSYALTLWIGENFYINDIEVSANTYLDQQEIAANGGRDIQIAIGTLSAIPGCHRPPYPLTRQLSA